jgi:hypothetical protein
MLTSGISIQNHLIPLNVCSPMMGESQRKIVEKSASFSTDTSVLFSISPVNRKANLALGYFSIDVEILNDLRRRVQVDPWAVNWAEYISRFFLKSDAIDVDFDLQTLSQDHSRFHFYWDGQDWFYLYAWEGKTQQFIEVISTAGSTMYFRQGQGTQTRVKTLARLTITENQGRYVA